jgi:hypothetical protein
MGTRHLIQVINNEGELKLSQYGQWDGYPSGKGVTTLFYLTYHRNEIENGLQRVRWATDEELEAIYAQYPESNYLGREDAKNLALLYPNLVRDTSADVLLTIAYSVGEVLLVDSSDFAEDTLMCEGIYTINYQDKTYTSTYHGVTWVIQFDELPDHEAYLKMYANAVKLAEENKEEDE